MTEEENKRQKHSAGGTKKAEQKCSQNDQPKISNDDLKKPQGFEAGMEEAQSNDPNLQRRQSLLDSIDAFHKRERRITLQKVKARKGPV